MHYLPLTDQERAELLTEIGVSSFDELVKAVPMSLRYRDLQIPEALSEQEVQRLLKSIGSKNATIQNHLSFLGGGSYEHFIPAAVSSITGRHEFYTAYTPYQPEASQGTLQAIYEFQSLVTELMGLDVSNASHYDGATSLAEAALLALRHTGRSKILIARSVHPQYRQVLKTYLSGSAYQIEEFGFEDHLGIDRRELLGLLNEDIAGVIIQTPNFFGVVENLEGLADQLHRLGSLLILSVNPISLGVLKSPGEWQADIATAEGQPLGIPVHYGGPYLGLFSVTRELMRKIPGRLAGLTKDSAGKRAFCLTLQAREQHIRREKAFSNICTNQALCALAACVYMTLLGKQGIRQIGEINMDRAYALREKISKLPGYSVDTSAPIFNEFIVKAKKPFDDLLAELEMKKILPGLEIRRFYPELKNHFLVCATETKTPKDLDLFVEALAC